MLCLDESLQPVVSSYGGNTSCVYVFLPEYKAIGLRLNDLGSSFVLKSLLPLLMIRFM